MTNTGICFQIKQAIDIQAELVIFRRTGSSRLDIPLYSSPSPNVTLKNFIYPYPSDSSFGNKYVGDITANILSDNAHGLSNQRPDSLIRIPDNIVMAIKNYYAFIFDRYLAEEKDRWIFEYWQQCLSTASIPYIELTADGIGREIYEYIRENPDKLTQKVYHTAPEPQQKVADSIIRQLEKWNQIGCNHSK